MDALRKIRTKLDSGTRRLVIDQLHRLDAERESFADIVERDRDWEVAVGYEGKPCDSMSHELSNPEECGLSEEEQKEILQLLQQMADLPESDQRKMQRDQDYHILALMRLLAVDLALRDCRDTCGSFPNDLSALTPQPLAEPPLDPYTENAFIYRRTSDTLFDLYSTGPKLTDSGGHFGPWSSVAADCADLCLDANDYSPARCDLHRSLGLAQRIAATIRTWWHVWRR